MIEVTATGSHAGNQAPGKVCHRLVDVVLWQLFTDGLQNDFQLVHCLGLLGNDVYSCLFGLRI